MKLKEIASDVTKKGFYEELYPYSIITIIKE